MNWKDRHVILTGSGSRLGKSVLNYLTNFSVKLTAFYHQHEPEFAAKNNVQSIAAVAFDLASTKSIDLALQAAIHTHGPIDILIHVAGIFERDGAAWSDENWKRNFEVNARGSCYLMRAVCERAKAAASVVYVGDIYAKKPLKNYSSYSASKAAAEVYVKNLALEFAPQVRVNAVCPGIVLPEQGRSIESQRRLQARSLLGVSPDPLCIAYAIEYLVQNDYVTGEWLNIDGGMLLI